MPADKADPGDWCHPEINVSAEPASKFSAGDLIVEVNGIRGDAQKMLDQVVGSVSLRVAVLKDDAISDAAVATENATETEQKSNPLETEEKQPPEAQVPPTVDYRLPRLGLTPLPGRNPGKIELEDRVVVEARDASGTLLPSAKNSIPGIHATLELSDSVEAPLDDLEMQGDRRRCQCRCSF